MFTSNNLLQYKHYTTPSITFQSVVGNSPTLSLFPIKAVNGKKGSSAARKFYVYCFARQLTLT